MAKFKKKPITVEATQWFKHGDHPAVKQRNNAYDVICRHCYQHMIFHGTLETWEGVMDVCPGDWVITGIKGEHYPCKPDIFEATYDKVED